MSFSVVFLSQGKIRLLNGSGSISTIESRFGNDLRAKLLKAQERHAWKNDAASGAMLSGRVLWGGAAAEAGAMPIYITSLAPGTDAGQFLYSMESDSMGAVIRVDQEGADELRLWTSNQQRIERLAVHPLGHIAGSVRTKAGAANIGVRLADTSGFGEVTEGDSIDTAPSWVPGDGLKIVFQSAGLGRHANGVVQGLGPFAIQLVDVDAGELTTLLEERECDLLTPRFDAGGNLWFIRRPYSGQRESSFLRFLWDLATFPVKLIYALLGFLDFFSKIFSGKGLKTAGGPAGKDPSIRQLMVWGNLVNPPKPTPDNDTPDLVPSTWKLIRRSPSGSEETMAKGVLSFDLVGDGVVYTNGSAVFHRLANGTVDRLAKEGMIEQLIVLPTARASE